MLKALPWRLGLVALFAIEASILAGGVLRAPTERVLGYEASGVWRALWTARWTLTGIRNDGRLPVDAPTLGFPAGGPLVSPSWLLDVLSLPFQPLWGTVATYNVLVLLHLVLAGAGAATLARSGGLSRLGAVVAGTIFGFNALLVTGGVASGRTDVLAMAWLPWCFAALHALVHRPGWRPVAAVAATWTLLVLGSLQTALVATIALPIVVAAALLDLGRSGHPPNPRRLVGALVATAVLTAVIFFVPLALFREAAHQSGALATTAHVHAYTFPGATEMSHLGHRYANLAGYFFPGGANLVVHEGLDLDVWSTYAGAIALVLATFGVRRGMFRWFTIGVIAATLALGPYFLVSLDSWRTLAVPWWVRIHDWLPWLLAVRDPILFAGLAFIALGLLAGSGADVLLKRAQGPRLRAGIAIALSAAILGESWLVSSAPLPFPSSSTELSPATAWLREASGGAVLDWPPRAEDRASEVGRYLWEQLGHGHPIAYDLAPTEQAPGPLESNPFWASLELATYGGDYVSPAWDDTTSLSVQRGFTEVQAMGYRWVVLHTGLVAEDRRTAVSDWLQAWAQPVETFDNGDVVYHLRAPRVGQRK